MKRVYYMMIKDEDELDYMVRMNEKLHRIPPAAKQIRRPIDIVVLAAPYKAHNKMPATQEFVNSGTPQAEADRRTN